MDASIPCQIFSVVTKNGILLLFIPELSKTTVRTV